jgi:hypothetical protein
VPAGGSVVDGVILDADGKPVLGADGAPLLSEARKRRHRLAALEAGKKAKRSKQSEIVPAGRMVTLTRLRAKDVPDMDRKGKASNTSGMHAVARTRDYSGCEGDAVARTRE